MSVNALKKLNDRLAGIITDAGFECVGIDSHSSSPKSGATIKIYIDRADGITHDDCRTVSNLVGDCLDREEEAGRVWFKGKYRIEVSSPGLERPLFTADHYRRFAGALAVITRKSGKKTNVKIVGCDDNETLTFESSDGGTFEVPLHDIRRANLVYTLPKGEKKELNKKN